MAIEQRRFVAAFSAATLLFLLTFNLPADAADGPNRVTSSDVAAGRWMDSLLDNDLDSAPRTRPKPPRPARRAAQRNAKLRGKLVRNSEASDGTPPFALVDRYGGVLRYVEPVDSVDLQKYLGKAVSVRHDTGDTLLASQLALPRSRRTVAPTGLNLAQHLEPIPAGEPVPSGISNQVGEPIVIDGPDNGPIYLDGGYEESYGGGYDDGLNFGGCPNCGDVTCSQRGGGCGFGARGVMYARGEYLLWWLEGMNTPELVVQLNNIDLTNPTNPIFEGPSQILYGGNRVLEDERSGGRITLGLWLDDYGQWGVEGDYLRLGEIEERFVSGQEDGAIPPMGSFIFRPFFNTADAASLGGAITRRGNAIEDVDTNRLDGTVTVDIRSNFQSAGIRLRHNLCCREGCTSCCGDAVGCGTGIGCGSGVDYSTGPLGRIFTLLRKGTRHTDILYGFRWTELEESLQVTESLQEFDSITANPPTLGDDIDVTDRFATENEFMGGEIGYETEWEYRRWSLNFLSKVAIGSTRQRVAISGRTLVDGVATPANNTGGLLTQHYEHLGGNGVVGGGDDFVVGNIGTYERDEFSMIPEIGLTMGYNLTRRLKLTAGYTLLYWSNVVRPGDQIDLDVNANLLPRRDGAPDSTTIVQDDHPRFEFRQTDLWAQGINFGAEYTW